jgi:hypothetical protein
MRHMHPTVALRLGEASASVALVRVWIAIVAVLAGFAIAEPAAAHPAGSPRSGSSIDAAGGSAPLRPVTQPAADLPATDRWVAAVLLSGLVGLWVTGGRRRRATALATSLLMLAFVSASAPHLVHHILDPEQAQHCEILKSVNHVEGATAASDPPPAPLIARPLAKAAPVPPAVETLAAACGRAPPAA